MESSLAKNIIHRAVDVGEDLRSDRLHRRVNEGKGLELVEVLFQRTVLKPTMHVVAPCAGSRKNVLRPTGSSIGSSLAVGGRTTSKPAGRSTLPAIRRPGQGSRENGHHPSARAAARRRERRLRPPTQRGTALALRRGRRQSPRSRRTHRDRRARVWTGTHGGRAGHRRARSTLVVWRADKVELLLQGPHSYSEDQAAVAHLVQRAVTLGNLERMVIPENQHTGGKADWLVRAAR